MSNTRLKFRQWSPKHNRFFYWGHKINSHGQPVESPEWTGPKMEHEKGSIVDVDQSEQFTGLWDGTKWDALSDAEKVAFMASHGTTAEWKGKEIYGGDIMRIELPAGGFWGKVTQTKIGKVKYESDNGGFIVVWEYSRNQHHENLTCDIAFTGEVIGNIHENPELL